MTEGLGSAPPCQPSLLTTSLRFTCRTIGRLAEKSNGNQCVAAAPHPSILLIACKQSQKLVKKPIHMSRNVAATDPFGRRPGGPLAQFRQLRWRRPWIDSKKWTVWSNFLTSDSAGRPASARSAFGENYQQSPHFARIGLIFDLDNVTCRQVAAPISPHSLAID